MRWPVVLLIIGAALLGAALFAANRLADTDQLRPQLEAYLSERTGLPVQIAGDLRWHWLPPVSLRVTDLRAAGEHGRSGRLDSIELSLSPVSALRAPQEPRRWRLDALRLNGLTYTQGERRVTVSSLRVRNLGHGANAPFNAQLAFARGGPEQRLTLDGNLTFDVEQKTLALTPLRLGGDLADGECSGEFALNPAPAVPVELPPNAVLDVNEWREARWLANCTFEHVSIDGARFGGVRVTSRNEFGDSSHEIDAADLFGGSGRLDLTIDGLTGSGAAAPSWRIAPTLNAVDGAAWLAWVERTSAWSGPINLTGELQLTGNERRTMAASAQGQLDFDSQAGRVDIRDIKAQMLALTQIFGRSTTVAEWPDVLEYRQLSAHWRPNGGEHTVAGMLDNLSLSGNGTWDPARERPLDLTAHLTFLGSAEPKPLAVNPLLEDVPLPLRCRGDLAAPNCGFDEKAGRQILGDLLSGEGAGGEESLRDKLEQRIEEDVPEQWQDAARSLLDLLGESLRKRAD